MSSFAGMVAPNRFSRLLAAADLAAVAAAFWVSLAPPVGACGGRSAMAPWLVGLLLLWVVVATTLRHYDLTEPRSLLDELAMATVLVAAATTFVALISLVAP